MSDQDDLNLILKLAQADPTPAQSPFRVIQGGKGKPVVAPPVQNVPKPVVVPPTVIQNAPKPTPVSPWTIFFQLVYSELFVTTQPAGSVRADQEARRRNQQNKVTQTGVKPESVPQTPNQIKPIPQAPSYNPPLEKPATPITEPTPVETPQPIPNFDPDKILEEMERNEKDRKRREQASDRERERKQKEKEKKAAEEREKERKRFDQDRKDIELNGQALSSSIKGELAIMDKFNQLRNAATTTSANDLNISSDELLELINNWEKRREKLKEIFEKKEEAFKKWKEKNPNVPDHVWLNGQGKKYDKSAIDLLNNWIQQDNQAEKDRSKKPKPETAQQRNDRIKKEQSNQSSEPDNGILRPINTNPINQASANPSPAANPSPSPQNQSSSGNKTIRDEVAKKVRQKFKERSAIPGEQAKINNEGRVLELSLDNLLKKGVNPDTIVDLAGKGLYPEKLGEYLDQFKGFQEREVNQRGNYIRPSFKEIADSMNILLGQLNNRFKGGQNPAERAAEIIKNSTSRRDIYEFTKILIGSDKPEKGSPKRGKLENPEMLEGILENFRTQTDESAAKGKLQELKFAAKLVQSGIDIALEKGADVLDKTRKIAWQVKNVDGDSKQALGKRLAEAADQLVGNNEVPPSGYKKGIYIEITNPNNPDYNKTPQQLESLIQEKLNSTKSLKAIDQVQITIGDKTLIFDVKNQTVKYNKTYPASQYRISDGNISPNTSASIQNVQGGTTVLQAALGEYRNASKNVVPNEINTAMAVNKSFELSNNILKLLKIQGNIFSLKQFKKEWSDESNLGNDNSRPPDIKIAQAQTSRSFDLGGR
jgi:hypothetical protein